ncbi:hypothetical protein CK203_079932 [Vitis vinifera]|uniref:Uncharacterized protein n=1 Tax=Vitis vinifera TaxID=29760 RepID=A0A438E4S4_VITVI|nr:hypothetical protein CK203_079932 [Vitis vinifera]
MLLETLGRNDVEALPFTEEVVSTLNSMNQNKTIEWCFGTLLGFVKVEVMSFFKFSESVLLKEA